MALAQVQALVCSEDKDESPPPQQPPRVDKTRTAPAPAVWNDRSAGSRCAWILPRQKNVRQIANHGSRSPDNIDRDLIACGNNDPKPDECLAVFGHGNILGREDRRQETGVTGVQELQNAEVIQFG